ncbi:hypothetical protein HYY69_04160 [Candidatus Woesearchaeota archaeon]|nr:hypothetical protein [Candidatus Woesearchaeota archaeon]
MKEITMCQLKVGQTLITQTPLFYPKDRKRIGSFQVNEVTPESITLERIVEDN